LDRTEGREDNLKTITQISSRGTFKKYEHTRSGQHTKGTLLKSLGVFLLGGVSVYSYYSKGKVVHVLNKAPRHEDVSGEWRYSSMHSLTSALDGG
jgi:hypothetical protein